MNLYITIDLKRLEKDLLKEINNFLQDNIQNYYSINNIEKEKDKEVFQDDTNQKQQIIDTPSPKLRKYTNIEISQHIKEGFKYCSKCEIKKDLSEYYEINSNGRIKYSSLCKDCSIKNEYYKREKINNGTYKPQKVYKKKDRSIDPYLNYKCEECKTTLPKSMMEDETYCKKCYPSIKKEQNRGLSWGEIKNKRIK